MAFHDIRPKAPVHVLVVPKEHVEKLSDYPDTEEGERKLGALFRTANRVARLLGLQGYRVQVNVGEKGGRRSSTSTCTSWADGDEEAVQELPLGVQGVAQKALPPHLQEEGVVGHGQGPAPGEGRAGAVKARAPASRHHVEEALDLQALVVVVVAREDQGHPVAAEEGL